MVLTLGVSMGYRESKDGKSRRSRVGFAGKPLTFFGDPVCEVWSA